MSEQGLTVVGLDLGSRLMKALMVAVDEDGALHYLAGLQMPSAGIREGMVSHPGQVAAMVVEALDRLEEESRTRIGAAWVGVNGPHMRSHLVQAEAPVESEDGVIGADDLQRVMRAIREQSVADRQVTQIHLIPRVYAVDGVSGFRSPLGLSGNDLAVSACVVSVPHVVSDSVRSALGMARVEPLGLQAAPVAAGESVRTPSNDRLPLAVVDIGAQTTGVAIYSDDVLWGCASLPVGGDTITQRITRALRFPVEVAERLKCDWATCVPGRVSEGEFIEMSQVSGDDEFVPAQLLAETARDGAMELASALDAHLRQAQRAGVAPVALTLTGGGAEMEGLATLLEGVLRIPVTVASPTPVLGAPTLYTRPAFAVATGLTQLAVRRMTGNAVHARRGATFMGHMRQLLHVPSKPSRPTRGRGASPRW